MGLILIDNAREFQRHVIQADRPVLVEFHKTGCPTCVLLAPGLDQLAEEYRGRVLFVRYRLMSPFFQVTSWRLMHRYRAYLLPTVVLIVGGQERRRWVWHFALPGYRKALDRVLAD